MRESRARTPIQDCIVQKYSLLVVAGLLLVVAPGRLLKVERLLLGSSKGCLIILLLWCLSGGESDLRLLRKVVVGRTSSIHGRRSGQEAILLHVDFLVLVEWQEHAIFSESDIQVVREVSKLVPLSHLLLSKGSSDCP